MVSSLLIPFFCILKGIKIKYPLVLILAPLFITIYFDIMKNIEGELYNEIEYKHTKHSKKLF